MLLPSHVLTAFLRKRHLIYATLCQHQISSFFICLSFFLVKHPSSISCPPTWTRKLALFYAHVFNILICSTYTRWAFLSAFSPSSSCLPPMLLFSCGLFSITLNDRRPLLRPPYTPRHASFHYQSRQRRIRPRQNQIIFPPRGHHTRAPHQEEINDHSNGNTWNNFWIPPTHSSSRVQKTSLISTEYVHVVGTCSSCSEGCARTSRVA